jgi:hypothetical protein
MRFYQHGDGIAIATVNTSRSTASRTERHPFVDESPIDYHDCEFRGEVIEI